MPRKFDRVQDTKYIIDALIKGDLKKAKKHTFKGLDFLLSDDSVIDMSPTRIYEADELAHRVCDVLISISCSVTLKDQTRYELMTAYRDLFLNKN